jgi:PadR family transcriptional regulator PadR
MSTREEKLDLLQGTLDLIVLRTLDTMGPQHGLGLAKRIEQISAGALDLNQGTIYPALLRLEQKGWIRSKWGSSDNNRKAKYYEITAAGKRQVAKEVESWNRTVGLMQRFVGLEGAEE